MPFTWRNLGAKAVILLAGEESPARAVAAELNIPVIELQPSATAGVFELHGRESAAAGIPRKPAPARWR